jgi:hypothetical protein
MTLRYRTVDKVAWALHKAGKISDLCENEGVFTRLTALERQFPSASVLVHKQGVLPPEIAALWASPALMSAAHQLLGGAAPIAYFAGGYCCMHACACMHLGCADLASPKGLASCV